MCSGQRGIDVFRGSASFEAYDTPDRRRDGDRRPSLRDRDRLAPAVPRSPAWPRPASSTTGLALVAREPSREPDRHRRGADRHRIRPKLRPVRHEGHGPGRVAASCRTRTPRPRITSAMRLEAEGVACGWAWRSPRSRCAASEGLHFRDTGQRLTGEVAGSPSCCRRRAAGQVDGLNLEAARRPRRSRAWDQVDDYLQTHARRVYAIGDVLMRQQYAHAAECEADVAFRTRS